MSAPVTENEVAASLIGVHACIVCGGPCLSWKGSFHGWTCTRCCAAYVEAGAKRGDERRAAERAQRVGSVAGAGAAADGYGPTAVLAPAGERSV
jgi:hypothetical protein